jgi:hypothetical protein
MPRDTLGPGEYLTLGYMVPRRGMVEFSVDADDPLTTYVFDPEGLREF